MTCFLNSWKNTIDVLRSASVFNYCEFKSQGLEICDIWSKKGEIKKIPPLNTYFLK